MKIHVALLLAAGTPATQEKALAAGVEDGVAPARSDIVIFVVDDVGDSDIDHSIQRATTNIRGLAAQGVRFRHAYSHTWCAPTRDSLLYSQWLGIYRGDDCGDPAEDSRPSTDFSLPEMLAGAGYTSCHFGKRHLGVTTTGSWQTTPQLVGFTSSRADYPIGTTCGSLSPPAMRARVDDGQLTFETGNESIAAGNSTLKIEEAFAGWWSATASPRFAIVNFRAAHAPFDWPPSEAMPGGYPFPPRWPPTKRQAFEAELASVDHALGRLMPLFGPEDVVLFMGDNGTAALAARPDQDPDKLKLTAFEGGIRIPFIWRGPGATPGLESSALVHVVDVLPTLAAMLGVSIPEVDGLSFLPALAGQPVARHFSFSYGPDRVANCMRDARWKLMTREDGTEELYDLQLDPTEANPLPPEGAKASYLRTIRGRILAGQSVLEW